MVLVVSVVLAGALAAAAIAGLFTVANPPPPEPFRFPTPGPAAGAARPPG